MIPLNRAENRAAEERRQVLWAEFGIPRRKEKTLKISLLEKSLFSVGDGRVGFLGI